MISDRRAWTRVSDIIKGREVLDALDTKLFSSIVGPKAASAFLASIRKSVSGLDVLNNFFKYEDELKKEEIHQLSAVSEGIFRHLEISDVPQKHAQKFADNMEKYFSLLSKTKKEACAHFCSLFTSGIYPQAVTFISVNRPSLTVAMCKYIEKLGK